METEFLILGATGSIGYAFAQVVLHNKIPITVLVRNREKAVKLFGENPLIEFVEGDATDRKLLKELSVNKNVIFHGINYPYNLWEHNMVKVTENIIEAAGRNHATIIFPGNIYEFGNVNEITENSIPHPNTKKGKIRLRLHELLIAAAESNICRVIFVRLPDFFGPNVTNGLMMPVFGKAAKRKSMSYLINADIPHQFVYTPDAARLMFELSLLKNLPPLAEFNYYSFTVSSFREFAKKIAAVSGGPDKVKVIPKWVLNIMAVFLPVIKELKENYYLFENNVSLNDDKIKKLLPDFQPATQQQMISETVEWFKSNT